MTNSAPTSRSITDQVEQTVNAAAEKLDLEARQLGGGYCYTYVDFYDKNLGLLMRVRVEVAVGQSGDFLISTTCYTATSDLVAKKGSHDSFRVPLSGPDRRALDRVASFVESWARQVLLERVEQFDRLSDEIDSSERG